MLDEHLTRRRKLSRARVLTIGAVSALTAAGTGGGLVARAAPGDPPGTIRTIAGVTTNYRQGGFAGDGGPAKDAQLYNPRAVAFSRTGEVYIGDALNHRIRKIDKDGIITTVAGNPTETSASGSPVGAFGGDGGPAAQAQLNQPHGVAVDSKGNVYVADSLNNRIRRIDTQGIIDTLVGSDNKKGRPEGPVETAVMKFPKTLFMTPDDVLYICNSGGNTVVKIDLKKTPLTVKRVAGNLYAKRYGGDARFATDAALNRPQGVWVTKDGTVYISDSENHLVRKVTPDGKITTIAGDTAAAQRAAETNQYPIPGDSSGDGGPAKDAHLNGPRGIAADDAGNIYIAEEAGNRIRRIDPSGTIMTIAGNGKTKGDGHDPHIPGDPGPAPALEAQFHTMHDLNLDTEGNLWIADSKNNRIRMVTDPANAPAAKLPAETTQEPPPQQQTSAPAQETPPPESNQAPPPQNEQAPPAQSEQDPPAQSEAAPPAESEQNPPAQTEAAPPAESEQNPPAQNEQNPPSAEGSSDPAPAGSTTTTTAAAASPAASEPPAS